MIKIRQKMDYVNEGAHKYICTNKCLYAYVCDCV